MRRRGLTPRQRIFIVEYLVSKNATKAAVNAGYSAKTARSAGARLLTNVDISVAIERGLAEQLSRAEISANRVIHELKAMAFADPLYRGCSGKLRALKLLLDFLAFKNQSTSKPQEAVWSTMDLLPPKHGRNGK